MAVPEVTVGQAGTVFFVGAYMATAEYPAALDRSVPVGHAWVAEGNNLDNLAANSSLLSMDELGWGGVWLIRAQTVPSDCNGNQIPDYCDIATGTSSDCNANGIPDECESGLKPTISQQPSSATACLGHSATFTVVASGTGPFEYQWRKYGVPISGAQQNTFTISAVTMSDTGSYDVVVKNGCTSTTSIPATLTVQTLLVTADPQTQTVDAGDAVTLSVAADGPEPLTYQWRKDGEPIAGAVQETYSLDPALIEHAGSYDVVVTSPCGSVTSAAAVLTVTLAAPAYPNPANQATNVSNEADLVWGSVFGAATYDVYFGTEVPPPLVGTSSGTAWKLPTLSYSTTYYWQIVARGDSIATEGSLWSFTTKPEPLKPPTAPTAPFPANGAFDVPVDVHLSWAAADRATIYRILLGEDVTLKSLRFGGSSTATQWTAASLVAGKTYYWRIIAKNDAGYTEGPTWSFTTALAATQTTTSDTTIDSGQQTPTDTSTLTTTDSGQETPADSNTQTDTVGDAGKTEPTAASALCPATSTALLMATLLSLWGSARPRPPRRA